MSIRRIILLFCIALWPIVVGPPLATAQQSAPTTLCAADHQVLLGSRLHMACGARLLVVELRTQRVLSDETLESPIAGFHISGDRVWAELADGRAQLASESASDAPGTPVSLAPEAAEPAVAEPAGANNEPGATQIETGVPEPAEGDGPAAPSAAPGLPAGRVLSVDDDEVVIDLGSDDGIDIGQRIDLTPLSDRSDWENSEEAVVGVVERVSADRARVRIRWSQTTEVGTSARPTEQGTIGSLVAPRALPRGLSVQASLMAALPVSDLGILGVLDGALTYRGGRFFMARAVLRSTGVSIGRGEDFAAGGGYLQVGFDHPLVGAAFGVGLERMKVGGWRDERLAPRLTFPSSFRVGSEDGLMFELTTLLTIEEGTIQLHALDGLAQIPLANGLWLQARGGGGSSAPFWHGGLGIRLALQGNGAPGTTSLEVGAGGLGANGPGTSRGGPSLRAGVRHRF